MLSSKKVSCVSEVDQFGILQNKDSHTFIPSYPNVHNIFTDLDQVSIEMASSLQKIAEQIIDEPLRQAQADEQIIKPVVNFAVAFTVPRETRDGFTRRVNNAIAMTKMSVVDRYRKAIEELEQDQEDKK